MQMRAPSVGGHYHLWGLGVLESMGSWREAGDGGDQVYKQERGRQKSSGLYHLPSSHLLPELPSGPAQGKASCRVGGSGCPEGKTSWGYQAGQRTGDGTA